MNQDIKNFEVVYDAPMQVGECPLWSSAEQALYWVDIGGFTVHSVHPASGAHREWRFDSEPASLALCEGGGLVVALRRGFVHLNTDTGAVTDIAAAPYDTATTRFNDGRVDALGRYWVGTIFEPRDRLAAEMYCLQNGKVVLKWSGGLMNSNGLGFSPDNTILYHADTAGHRVNRYPYHLDNGIVGDVTCFAQFDSDKKAPNYGGRPDGAAVDSEGAYWIAMFEGGRVLRFAPSGQLLAELKLPLRCPTMVAFGGEDLKTLFITSASHGRSAEELAQYPLTGKVLSVRVEVAGRVEHRYRP
ncbi:MAG: SMP-30/gluconolactonase/LRE family protein [Gammaproteobacteria bacterium]